jgi:hypothetical protein
LNKKWILLGIWVVSMLLKIGDKILFESTNPFSSVSLARERVKGGNGMRAGPADSVWHGSDAGMMQW